MNYIGIISIFISFVSLVLASISFWRSKKFQDFEYAPMLQLNDKKVRFDDQKYKKGFALEYEAYLQNQGLKPIKIRDVHLDYGSHEFDKRLKYFLCGEKYLGPNNQLELKHKFRWDEIEQVKEKFGLDECVFFLRIGYEDISGDKIEKTRMLGGYGSENSSIVVIKHGSTVS